MCREQLLRQSASIGDPPTLQVRLEQVTQTIRMVIDVSDLFKEWDRRAPIPGFQGIPAPKQQRVAVAGIERQHALQNFFGAAARTAAAQALSRRREDLPGFGLLP